MAIMNVNTVTREGALVMARYVHDRVKETGIEEVPETKDFIDAEVVKADETVAETETVAKTETGAKTAPTRRVIQTEIIYARLLKQAGDEINRDRRLQELLKLVSQDNIPNLMEEVLKQLFSDGLYNWGRVATVFAFAFRLCAKALVGKWKVSLVGKIIHPLLLYFRDHIAPWIIGIGGWHTIVSYIQERRVPILKPVMVTAGAISIFAAGFLFGRYFLTGPSA